MLAHEGARWLGVGTLEREQGRAKRRHVAWIVIEELSLSYRVG